MSCKSFLSVGMCRFFLTDSFLCRKIMGYAGDSRYFQGHAGKQANSFVLSTFSSDAQEFPAICAVFVAFFWKGEVDQEVPGNMLVRSTRQQRGQPPPQPWQVRYCRPPLRW